MSAWDFIGFIDRDIRERVTFEARFLAGRARLAFSPPGSWPRSPQLPPDVAWRQRGWSRK